MFSSQWCNAQTKQRKRGAVLHGPVASRPLFSVFVVVVLVFCCCCCFCLLLLLFSSVCLRVCLFVLWAFLYAHFFLFAKAIVRSASNDLEHKSFVVSNVKI